MDELPTTYLRLPLGAPCKLVGSRMEWKSSFVEGFHCGKRNIFQNGEGLFFKAP